MAKFQKGQSGNPAGRPKGVPDRRGALRAKLLPHAEDLITMVVAYAKAGDMQAMRIVMERILPPLKEEPLDLKLPKIDCPEDCSKAQAHVLQAVASGELLPSEGQAMSNLIDAQRRSLETTDIAAQLQALRDELTQLKDAKR